MSNPVGVLLMAYGTPRSADPEDVLKYYTHIRHGHPPSAAQLDDLVQRYQAIGGSPLFTITSAQADALQSALDHDHGPGRFRIYLGLKHTTPFIADGVRQMAEDGIQRAVLLVLAPHYSNMSVGVYLSEAESAADLDHLPLQLIAVRQWHLQPGLIQLWADRIRATLGRFSPDDQGDVPVVFSAHSLPQRILQTNDPYPQQLHETGEAVARHLNLPHYTFSWQSAGRTSEPWMEPDILDKLTLLRNEGHRSALICPLGFVSDHLEVLYDLDIQAQAHARALGMHIERTPQLNADPAFAAVLAEVVRHAADTP